MTNSIYLLYGTLYSKQQDSIQQSVVIRFNNHETGHGTIVPGDTTFPYSIVQDYRFDHLLICTMAQTRASLDGPKLCWFAVFTVPGCTVIPNWDMYLNKRKV